MEKNKTIIDGDNMVRSNANGNYIRLSLDDKGNTKGINEIMKISKCKDNDEFIITGKQLKELQAFWQEDKLTNTKD